jgi:hypothetical protein
MPTTDHVDVGEHRVIRHGDPLGVRRTDPTGRSEGVGPRQSRGSADSGRGCAPAWPRSVDAHRSRDTTDRAALFSPGGGIIDAAGRYDASG